MVFLKIGTTVSISDATMSDQPDEGKVETTTDGGSSRQEAANKYGSGIRDLTATLSAANPKRAHSGLAQLTSSVTSAESISTSAAVDGAIPDMVENCFHILKDGQKHQDAGTSLLDKVKENAERHRQTKKLATEAGKKDDEAHPAAEEKEDLEPNSGETILGLFAADQTPCPQQRSSHGKTSYVDMLSGGDIDSDSDYESDDMDMSRKMKDLLMSTSTGEHVTQRHSASGVHKMPGHIHDDNCKSSCDKIPRRGLDRARSERMNNGSGRTKNNVKLKRNKSTEDCTPKPSGLTRAVSTGSHELEGHRRGVNRTKSGRKARPHCPRDDEGAKPTSLNRTSSTGSPSGSPTRVERVKSSRNVSRSPRRVRSSGDGETDGSPPQPPAMKRNLSTGSTGSGEPKQRSSHRSPRRSKTSGDGEMAGSSPQPPAMKRNVSTGSTGSGERKQRSSTGGTSRLSPTRSPRKKGELDSATEHSPRRRGEPSRGLIRNDSSSSVGSAAKRQSRSNKLRPMLGRSDSEGSAGGSGRKSPTRVTSCNDRDLSPGNSGSAINDPDRRRARDMRMVRASSQRNLSPSRKPEDLAGQSEGRVRDLRLAREMSKRSLSPQRRAEDLEEMPAIPMPGALSRGVSAGNAAAVRRAPLDASGEEALQSMNIRPRVPRPGMTRSLSEKAMNRRQVKPSSDLLASHSGMAAEKSDGNSSGESPMGSPTSNRKTRGDDGEGRGGSGRPMRRVKSSGSGDEMTRSAHGHRRKPRRKPTDDGHDHDLSPDEPRRKPRRKPTDDGPDPDHSPDERPRRRPEDRERRRRPRQGEPQSRSNSPTRTHQKSRGNVNRGKNHQFDIAKNQYANMVKLADEKAREQEEEEEKERRRQEEEEEERRLQALEEAAALAEAEAEEEARRKKKGFAGVAKFAVMTAKMTASVATTAATTGVNLASTAATTSVNLASTAATTSVTVATTAAGAATQTASSTAKLGFSTVKGAVNAVSAVSDLGRSSHHVKAVKYDLGSETHSLKESETDRKLMPAPSMSALAGGVLGGSSSAFMTDDSFAADDDDGAID
ncbi:expressed unknown protein [Seminavis robusta]|uniref:Uncharacterized protein n=1 Tax=Seminavis robusta TaxID=568900 RepID=A0A9N8EXZ2_9STRA|nr:expressed unknown protein [Seminavis robusta]|eukprot:Sro2024_g311590.1 n/a (1054) ;mRNA; f:7275-10436